MNRRKFLQFTAALGVLGLTQSQKTNAHVLIQQNVLLTREKSIWKSKAPESCLLSIVNKGPGVVNFQGIPPGSTSSDVKILAKVWPGFSADIDVDAFYNYQLVLANPDSDFWWRTYHDPDKPKENLDGVWSFVDVIQDRVETKIPWALPKCVYPNSAITKTYFPGFRVYRNLSEKRTRACTFYNEGPGNVELHASKDKTLTRGQTFTENFKPTEKCQLRKVTEDEFARGWFITHNH